MAKRRFEQIERFKAGRLEVVTERARVPRGWLVRTLTFTDPERAERTTVSAGLCFVLDPDHMWALPTEEEP